MSREAALALCCACVETCHGSCKLPREHVRFEEGAGVEGRAGERVTVGVDRGLYDVVDVLVTRHVEVAVVPACGHDHVLTVNVDTCACVGVHAWVHVGT